LSQNLPLAQRYFIEASLARVTKDNQKALAAYENLAKSFPDNLDVQFALGSLYEDAGDLDKGAFQLCERAAADSKNLDALLAMGRVEIKPAIRRRDSIRSIRRGTSPSTLTTRSSRRSSCRPRVLLIS
jgi:tetratricopeptide (TPR) repeat protein